MLLRRTRGYVFTAATRLGASVWGERFRRVYDVHGDLREMDDGWTPRVPRWV